MNATRLGRGCAIALGDALDVLRGLEPDSIHACVADPPGGAEFMQGRLNWDCFRRAKNVADVGRKSVYGRTSRTSPHSYGESSRANFVAAMTEIFSEVRRVLKPGAHALVWAFPRTQHWTTWALEDAGFEVRVPIFHAFGQGYAKSYDAAKAIQKRAGVRPLRTEPATLGMARNPQWNALKNRHVMPDPAGAAAAWQGWNAAMKPAVEPWILVRKPLDGTMPANLLRHGTGALHVAACAPPGRKFPANLILSHAEGCLPGACMDGCDVLELDEQAGKRPRTGNLKGHEVRRGLIYNRSMKREQPFRAIRDGDRASRFFPVFYAAKATVSEKEAGLEELQRTSAAERTGREPGSAGLVMEHADGRAKANPYAGPSGQQARANTHPTPKPVALMRWLVRLITPAGGVVLDPFMGSGTTGVACVEEGVGFYGIEREPEYFPIAEARIRHAVGERCGTATL